MARWLTLDMFQLFGTFNTLAVGVVNSKVCMFVTSTAVKAPVQP